MTLGQVFISIGLTLDMLGVVLLYMYALPSNFPEDKPSTTWTYGPPQEGDRRTKWRYRFLSCFGLALLLLGFFLQIVGTLCT